MADLLFISLHTAGYDVSREFPIGARAACDLVIHESKDIFVEAKQLHLKDGCKYAPSNLSRDLGRHLGQPSLGIIYVLDERASTLQRRYKRFGDMNKNAMGTIDDIISGLKDAFAVVFPNDTKAAMLKSFDNQGRLDIFGFVVAEPMASK